MSRRRTFRDVPCNGCTLCCQGDAVKLEPEDDPARYETVPHPSVPGARMLAHTATGECVYLGRDGCRIHRAAPVLCRQADCRGVAARLRFDEALALHRLGTLDLRVWDRGRRLLEEAVRR
jgi:hypothetical protein